MKHKVPLFIYGTLQDFDVMKLVTQRETLSQSDFTDASLNHFCLEEVKDENYPLLVKRDHHIVMGKIFIVESEQELNRLKYFEDEQEYTLTEHIVETKSGKKECLLFFPTSNIESSQKSWSYNKWSQVTNKVAFLERVKNYMSQFNTESHPKW
ncbi:gamma-glutamylcyclotransferase family protein [Halobacteriovorax sp. HLS]|uniref:gamma-glutamylcyclotransferase family protein n=1 Tax=Halobacteriovorax sp. HLS TaxID=2234000 RepID=UPI000FDC7B7D|nr:gamma-glutamylcyclotransferase family protein [Halobacteriovorax sp. HLS]